MGEHRNYRRGGFVPWFRGQYRRSPKPLWMVIVADALLFVAAMLVFALFHHVLPRHETSVGLVSSREMAAANRIAAASGAASAATANDAAESPDASASDGTATAAETAAETADAPAMLAGDLFDGIPGNFGEVFADKFTDGQVIKSDDGYRSANVNVSLNRYQSEDVVFYVADIYIRDISCFVTAFAKDRFGKGIRNWATDINRNLGGVIAINGDYYGGRSDGIVIRNGELYRTDAYPDRDVCVLFWDGTMETYSDSKFNAEAAINNGAYQAWNFGPQLLDGKGKAMTRFNSDVGPANPRTALGYFEPGHYCFVVVDGRSGASGGMTLTELSALMEQLGCVRAYNMDGGNTSVMVVGSKIVNNPSGGGRPTTDIIAIVDK